MCNFSHRLLLVFIFSAIQFFLCKNIHAQEEFFLDAFEEVTFVPPASGHSFSIKYLYNNDCKLGKVISDSRIILYTYENKKTTREVTTVTNSDVSEKLETFYNDDNQIIQNQHWRNSRIEYIDSFFYENKRLQIKKTYEIPNYSADKLIATESYEYADSGLIECYTYTDYTGYFNNIIDYYIKETYQYDDDMNMVSKIETYSSNPDKIYYDSTTYSYDVNQKLYRSDNVNGSSNSIPSRTFSTYSYKDSTTIEHQYQEVLGEWTKTRIIETENTLNEFYDFSKLTIYTGLSTGDTIILRQETNKLIYSSGGDSVTHRKSETIFNSADIVVQYVAKSMYKKHPEFINPYPEQLEDLKIYPNPIMSNGVIQIPNLKFDYDKAVIYNINNGEMRSIKVDRSKHYFNAPHEVGMYVIQLWNKDQAVTKMAKIIVQ
ncbi:hypothetical protein N9B82_02035 [Saprospiraceae bacterium]|nr:hypothetical protein [Saprospiraceae bacterium]